MNLSTCSQGRSLMPAHMVTVQESQEDVVKHGDTQAFEDTIADASDRLSAEIVKAAFVSLDTNEPFIIHEGQKYHRHSMTKKRVMTSFGAIDHERARYRRRAYPSLFPADRRAGLIEDFWTQRAARIALHMVSSLPPAGVCAAVPSTGCDVSQRGQPCTSL